MWFWLCIPVKVCANFIIPCGVHCGILFPGPKHSKTVVKVKMSSGVDLNQPSISDSLLKQVRKNSYYTSMLELWSVLWAFFMLVFSYRPSWRRKVCPGSKSAGVFTKTEKSSSVDKQRQNQKRRSEYLFYCFHSNFYHKNH